jgi:hypothetical protein
VGRDFEPIAAKLHAAPATPVIARLVVEEQDALRIPAAPDEVGVGVAEQVRCRLGDRAEDERRWIVGGACSAHQSFAGLGELKRRAREAQTIVEHGEVGGSQRLMSWPWRATCLRRRMSCCALDDRPERGAQAVCSRKPRDTFAPAAKSARSARRSCSVQKAGLLTPSNQAVRLAQELDGPAAKHRLGVQKVQGKVIAEPEKLRRIPVVHASGERGIDEIARTAITVKMAFYRLEARERER